MEGSDSEPDDDFVIETSSSPFMDLVMAASVNAIDTVKAILWRSSDDINRRNVSGWTALMYASHYGYCEVLEKLVLAGADVTIANNDGKTALMMAASLGKTQALHILIKAGARINAEDKRGRSSLFYSVYFYHGSCAELLLQNGANPNSCDIETRESALMTACHAGAEGLAELLLKFGADPFIPDKTGATARDIASSGGFFTISQMLLRYEQARDVYGVKPLSHDLHGIKSPSRDLSKPQVPVNDLTTLLRLIGMEKYNNLFEKEEIDLYVFLTLTDEDLQSIGISLFGPRRKMLSAISRWNHSAPLPSNSEEMVYSDRLYRQNCYLYEQLSVLKDQEKLYQDKHRILDSELQLVYESVSNFQKQLLQLPEEVSHTPKKRKWAVLPPKEIKVDTQHYVKQLDAIVTSVHNLKQFWNSEPLKMTLL